MRRSPIRQSLLAPALTLTLSLAAVDAAHAQDVYPSKLVRLVVPYAPGGSSDIMGRALAQKLGELWKQPVVLENKPGGTTTVGTEYASKQPADGYTLLLAAPPFVITKYVYPKLGYDPERDFAPVSLVAFYPLVLVTNTNVPAKTLGELIALAKQKPGMAYPSPGNGTTPHLTGELIKQRMGVDIVHVAYKSGGQAVTDLIGGQTQFYFGPTTEVVSQVRSGKLNALAVLAPKRSSILPNVPTAAEGGFNDLDVLSWSTVVVPAGTPPAIVQRISADIAKVVAMPDFRERFASQGAELVGSTPEELAKFYRAEHAKWGPVVKSAGITAD